MSELKHVKDRVIVSVDLDAKDSHTFEDGTKIYRGRRFNNLNLRETNPVNAIVISAENIPKGAEILVHPNEFHDSNKIFNHESLSGKEAASRVKYYSAHEYQCFIWREEGGTKWRPLKNFATGLRLFQPYKGNIAGIKPLQIQNLLYITSGEYEGMVCHTVRSADYEIIFQGMKGTEERIIRCRHYEGIVHDREEIICIDLELTRQVNEDKILIGLSISDCQTLNQYQCQLTT